MLVDVRPSARLGGAEPLDLPAALGCVIDVLSGETVDLARTRVVCDWIQYRANFRNAVDVRQVGDTGMEVALDLRRGSDGDLAALTRQALAGADRTYLEGWVPGGESVIWRFNALYWQALSLWEEATGKRYEQALPGGRSDAHNVDAARALIRRLFDVWDALAARNALPETLYVVEIGVGNGNQARVWLDEFARMDRDRGSDYYRRLHYLMGDYSPHVLDLARAAVAAHAEHVSTLVLDARAPAATLGFLRYKAFLVYISNVYDNLPTDEVAWIAGRAYRVEVRAYLPGPDTARLADEFSVSTADIPGLVARLLRLGPELLADAAPGVFPDVGAAVQFWRECWAALKLEERYVPVDGLDLYQVAPRVTGEVLRPLLESGGDIRMQTSTGAVASFIDTLPLLHPYGWLHCHDLFVTDTRRYGAAFCGPGKYDGSVVNWVNGALLQHIGARLGFNVTFEKFEHRKGANVSTLVAEVRD